MISKTYVVTDGRVRFVCCTCRSKKSISVRPTEKRRAVTCHKCGTKNACNFNRRRALREAQSGKALVELGNGQRLAIEFCNISCSGVGFLMAPGYARRLSVGQELKGIICEWNRTIVPRKRLVVCNVAGNRVGARFIA